MHIVGIEGCHFLRANAAAIPPAISPTAVAAMPIPITPSAFQQMHLKFIQINAMMRMKKFKYIPHITFSNSIFNCLLEDQSLPPIRCNLQGAKVSE